VPAARAVPAGLVSIQQVIEPSSASTTTVSCAVQAASAAERSPSMKVVAVASTSAGTFDGTSGVRQTPPPHSAPLHVSSSVAPWKPSGQSYTLPSAPQTGSPGMQSLQCGAGASLQPSGLHGVAIVGMVPVESQSCRSPLLPQKSCEGGHSLQYGPGGPGSEQP
jgi:hypothetical protein